MEARSFAPPAVNTLLVGRHRSNAGRMARVVAVSPSGEHVCLWHGYRMAWNLTTSVLKNYTAANDDSGDILAIPGDKTIPALAAAPTERPDASTVEPLPTVGPEPAPVAEVIQPEENEPAVDAPIEAPAGRMLALFHGVPVAIGASPEVEPLVRDLTLAERLGYASPRQIRKLIKRCMETGLLRDVACRSTVERQRTGFGERSYEVTEFWLTEAQALSVILRSDTPSAISVQHEMVAVYMAARRGLLTPAPAPAPAVDYAALGTAIAAAVTSTMAPMLEAVVSRLTRPADPPSPPPAPPPAPPNNVKDIDKERAFKAVWTEQAPVYRPRFAQFTSQSLDRVDITRESERLRALTSGDLHKHFSSWLARRGVAAPHPRVTYKLINEITTLYAGRTDDPSRQVRPFALCPQMTIEGSGR